MGKLKFKYNDLVEVINDEFYEGCVGRVLSYNTYTDIDTNKVVCDLEVKLDHSLVRINEDNLKFYGES